MSTLWKVATVPFRTIRIPMLRLPAPSVVNPHRLSAIPAAALALAPAIMAVVDAAGDIMLSERA